MSRLLILGAGGHAKVVAETAIASGHFSEAAFLDDRCSGPDQRLSLLGFPVLGPLALALEPAQRLHFASAVVAIGNAAARLNWIEQLDAAETVREAKLVYESLAKALVKPRRTVSEGRVLGSSSQATRAASTQTTTLNEGVEAERWARLAGIK